MLLLLTGTADFPHPGKVTSHLCDGLMPFVGFFSRSLLEYREADQKQKGESTTL